MCESDDGKSRKITVKLTTTINRDWVNAAEKAGLDPTHTNKAWLTANDIKFKPKEAPYNPEMQSIEKDWDGKVGTVTIGDVTLPVYKYTVKLTGVGSGEVDITDTYGDYLMPITPVDTVYGDISFDKDHEGLQGWLYELYTKVADATDP